jgi:hypothetical protein
MDLSNQTKIKPTAAHHRLGSRLIVERLSWYLAVVKNLADA